MNGRVSKFDAAGAEQEMADDKSQMAEWKQERGSRNP